MKHPFCSLVAALTLLLPLSSIVHATAWSLAEPTPPVWSKAGQAVIDAFSPKTTEMPALWGAMNRRSLMGKLEDRAIISDTCGYADGIETESLTCQGGRVCATNSANNVAACCYPSTTLACAIPTSCVPSAAISMCDDSCMSNAFNLICSDTASPFCFTWYFDYVTATPSEFGCSDQAFTQDIYLTYSGENSNTAGSLTDFSATQVTLSLPTLSGSGLLSASGQSQGSSPQETVFVTTSPGSSTNIGAIVGGVVGGVVAGGIIVVLIVWLVLRSRRKSRRAKEEQEKKVQEQQQNNFNPNGAPGSGPVSGGHYQQPSQQGSYNQNMTGPAGAAPYYDAVQYDNQQSYMQQQQYPTGGQFMNTGANVNDKYTYTDPAAQYAHSPPQHQHQQFVTDQGVIGGGNAGIVTSLDNKDDKEAVPPVNATPIHEADSAPVLTTSDGRLIHELGSS